MTEPSGGSDLAALKTTAIRDGDHYIVSGSKTFITNGYQGDLAIIAARTDPSKGPKGISLLMLEAGMEGFTKVRSSTRSARTSRTPPSSSSTMSKCPSRTSSARRAWASSR